MKILKYKKLKDNRYHITLEDNYDIKIYDDLIIKYNLLCKKELSKKELDEINKDNDLLEAYYKSLKYLTIKMRTEKELRKYLSKYDKNIIDFTIDKIKKEGYINEKLYLESFIRDKVNLTNFGPNKIVNELVKLGYKEEIINEELSRIDKEIWEEKLTKLIDKKITSNNSYGSNRLKEKIIYDMVNNGYNRGMIIDILETKIIKNDNKLLEKEYNKFYNKLSKKYEGDALKYQIRNKLLYKGFSIDEISEIIDK